MKFLCQIISPVKLPETIIEARGHKSAAQAHVSLDGPRSASRTPFRVSVSRFDGSDSAPKIIIIKP